MVWAGAGGIDSETTRGNSSADDNSPQLPQWYLSHRTHAHTRLSVNSFCHKNGSEWGCKDVFQTAGKLFASLGAPAYVRHTHTGDEGLLWRSSTAPRAGWHPLVADTGRNLPREFLTEAKAAGVAVVFYHYMKCQPFFAEVHPDWVMRTPNGSALGWSRCPNGGLSTCVPAWRQTYIKQILELIEMAREVGQEPAFYFDEFPSSPSGDFNGHCQTEFRHRYGYTMPAEPTQDVLAFNQAMTEEYFAELLAAIRGAAPRAAALVSITFAPSLDNHAWMNYTNTIEAGDGMQDVAKVEFAKGLVARPISSKPPPSPTNATCAKGWSPAVSGRSPGSVLGAVSVVSFELCQAACCANHSCLAVIYQHHAASSTSNISNCHLLDRTYNKLLQCMPGDDNAPVVANRYGGGVAPSICPKASPPALPGASIDADVLLSWAWALGRDASNGRPPHTWIPFVRTPEQAECAASALRAYGHVANPDHTENEIPNVPLYGKLYETAAALDKGFAGLLPKPVRYAAVVHSEKARNAIYASPVEPRLSPTPENLARAWKDLLYPAAGMWQSLVRAGVPAAIVPDWLLERNAHEPDSRLDFQVLLAPAKGYLEASTEQALEALMQAGVTVIRAEAEEDWEDPTNREVAGRTMLNAALAATGNQQPRVSFPLCCPRSSDQPLHVIAYDLSTAATSPSGTRASALMIHVLNGFAWCSPSGDVKVPPPAPPAVEAGTKVVVRDVPGPATATAVLTGDAVAMVHNGSQLELVLPRFDQSFVIRVNFD